MLQRCISSITATVVATVAVAPVALHAQEDRQDGPAAGRYTIAASFGGLSRPARLNAAGAPDWRQGWAGSVDATYWLNRNVGLRAGGTLAQDQAGSAPVYGETFNKITYDADVVWRGLRQAGQGMLMPYVAAGAGGITIHPIGSSTSWTRPAGNAGLGVEYRLPRWGVRAEARDYVYKFDQYGYDHVQNQVVWQGGLTLSF